MTLRHKKQTAFELLIRDVRDLFSKEEYNYNIISVEDSIISATVYGSAQNSFGVRGKYCFALS